MTVDVDKIVKGLECCLSPVSMCTECPYIAQSCMDLKREMYGYLTTQTAEAEIEGGGKDWFFVCGECRTVVGNHDKFCKNCGRKLIWA